MTTMTITTAVHRGHGAGMVIVRVAPGVALCALIALASDGLQALEQRLLGRPYLEGVALAIILGVTVRTLRPPSARLASGIHFSARALLEVAVVLLGASVSAGVLLSIGPALLAGIAALVVVAILVSYGLGRLCGLPPTLSVLVACGNSICGNSAIAAVAPIVDAHGDDVSAAIGLTAVLGVASVLGLPLIGGALRLGAASYGALAGLTVYAVPQVLAATAPMGALAVQTGTVIKLARVLMLGPVSFALALAMRGKGDQASAPKHAALPLFILGFLALMAVRSAGLFPQALLAPTAATAGFLTTLAMAALGLETDLRMIAKVGGRVGLAAVLSLLALGAMALGLVKAAHLG